MFLTVRYMGCYYHFHCCMDYCRSGCNHHTAGSDHSHHTADSGCIRRYMAADSGCIRRTAGSDYSRYTAGSDIHHYMAGHIRSFRCTY